MGGAGRIGSKAGGMAGLLAVALLVAACGGSGSNKASAPPASAPSLGYAGASSTGMTIGTAKGSEGVYLTGASGRALYLWAADSGGRSSCSGACANTWPPLITTGSPSAGGGVNSADLGTLTRSNGQKQVTYNGHPLYYFVADKSSGMTRGQGSDSFGAKWWLVSPSGGGITSVSSSSSSSSSSSGYTR